jgi:hypothetical protein
MARVQFSGGVEEIRGSIAGSTFSKNNGGNIIRSRRVVSQTMSSFQSVALSQTNSLQNLWRQQDESTVQDWNAFAALHTRVNMFGRLTKLSGQQWFLSCQSNRLLLGLPTLTSPPTYVTVPSPVDNSINTNSTDIYFSITDAAFTSDVALVLFTSNYTQLSLTLRDSALYLTKIIPTNTSTAYIITADHENTFGIPWPPSSPCRCSLHCLAYYIHKASGINSAGLRSTTTAEHT